MIRFRGVVAALALIATVTSACHGGNSGADHTRAEPGDVELAQDSLRHDLTRERFYFVMTDRFANGDRSNDNGGLIGNRLVTGYDPSLKGFYHGGDLRGLIDKLDYLQGMGTTAIWMTPLFKNRPVQGEGEGVSAGYHGYWVTDFTQVDPHLGTNAELQELVGKAHARGMKVFFDIITNHTADVIDYVEKPHPYRSKSAYPYVDADGHKFDDRNFAGSDNFPKLGKGSFPYTPTFRSEADATVKAPAWLNDPTMYHNRGESTLAGESSEYGDFAGLDDLFTERPQVVNGMVDIYRTWVKKAGIDGFRIDTVRHVNIAFWQEFAPKLTGYAASIGNGDFLMFGEVFDPDPTVTSRYSTQGRLQATLDFPFQEAARGFASRSQPTDRLRELFAKDDDYTDADSNAYSLPTFLGNHDMGRIGYFLRTDNADASDAELVRRDLLAHELMYFSRGMPVVYYGDEQGFTGKGGDQDARQTMFASSTQSYLTDDLLGTDATHAQDNYTTTHPVYRALAALAALTKQHPTLRDGAQVHRLSSSAAGVYAFSRIDRHDLVEYVVALNNSEADQTVQIPTYSVGMAFDRIYPNAGTTVTSGGDRKITVTVPALSTVVYQARGGLVVPSARPTITITAPRVDSKVGGRVEVSADVTSDGFTQVTFAAKVGDRDWQVLGTDDNAPYRVFHDVSGVPPGTPTAYKAVVKDHAGNLASARRDTVLSEEPAAEGRQ
jgi:glycosidase